MRQQSASRIPSPATSDSRVVAVVFAAAVACVATIVHVAVIVVANPVLDHPALRRGRGLLVAFVFCGWVVFAAAVSTLRRIRARRGRLAYAWAEAVPVYAGLGVVLAVAWNVAIDPSNGAFLTSLLPQWPWWPLFVAGAATVLLPLMFWYLGRRRCLPFAPLPNVLVYLAAVPLALLLVAIAVGPGIQTVPAPQPPATAGVARVRMLALDGADWRVIDERIAAGELPSFARLRQDGLTAPLQTIRASSPVIWTSIATGYPPQVHGVAGFFEYYLPRLDLLLPVVHVNPILFLPPSAYQRRALGFHRWQALPLWLPLDTAGRSSLVFRWLFSGPPPQLRHGIVRPDNSSPAAFCARPLPPVFGPVTAAVVAYCEAPFAAVGSAATSAAQQRYLHDWPLFAELAPYADFAVYYHSYIDGVSHQWHDAWRRHGGQDQIDSVRAAKEAVYEAYRIADRQLGRLFADATSRDVVVVVSDHGWDYDVRGHYYFPPGIFGLWRLEGVGGVSPPADMDIYHIAPLLSVLEGVPLAGDWPGLADGVALARALYPGAPTVVSNTYARAPQVTAPPYDPEGNRRFVERLYGLGYLQ